jgi:hypothetical protein
MNLKVFPEKMGLNISRPTIACKKMYNYHAMEMNDDIGR